MSAEEFCRDDPTGLMHEQAEMFAYVEEFGFHGKDPKVLTPVEVSDVSFPRCFISLTLLSVREEDRC